MGHVLGIGTLWNYGRTLRTAPPDYRFTGKTANVHYADDGGVGPVPVQDMSGPGTRAGHRRESTFLNELRTGFMQLGVNPLSRITAGSMRDMGYGASLTAEEYALPAPAPTVTTTTSGGAAAVEEGLDIANGEEILQAKAIVLPAP